MSHSIPRNDFDAIIIGGNLVGLYAAFLLRQLGFETCVLESSPTLGGMDRSFENPNGLLFDMGFHAVDHNRSVLATRFFSGIMEEGARVVTLNRHIAVGREHFPYAAPKADWPDALQHLLVACSDIDTLDDENISLEDLSQCYGAPFIDFVMRDMVPSYPALIAQQNKGVAPGSLLRNLYPWFFPNIPRVGRRKGESSIYHQKIRDAGGRQQILYPAKGGFGQFVNTIEKALLSKGVTIQRGVGPVALKPGTGSQIDGLELQGKTLRAPLYVWSAGLAPIFRHFQLAMPDAIPLEFLLASFEFDRELSADLHEILVADSALSLNRLSLPAALLRDRPNRQIQAEYAVPKSAQSRSDGEWIATWLEDFKRLGLLSSDNSVSHVDVKRLPLAECLPGVESAAVDPLLVRYDAADSNLCLLSRSFTPRNINQAIPDATAMIGRFAAQLGAVLL